MADYEFEGAALANGSLTIPIAGVWTAEVYFTEPDGAPAVGASGVLSVLGTPRRGTVSSSGSDGGYARARLVGGAGRLDQPLGPTEWRGYLLGRIARDCLSEAGEAPGEGWDALTLSCAHWQRPQGPLREALRRVARLLGPDQHWRPVADGSIALLDDSAWPDGTAGVDTEQFAWPQESCAQWFPATGACGPGQSLTLFGQARRLERVEYRWCPEEVTCRGWY